MQTQTQEKSPGGAATPTGAVLKKAPLAQANTNPLGVPGQGAGPIVEALQGRRAGRGWVAKRPAHDDRTPSLSIADAGDGRVLVHCHAGCDQSAVIDALRAWGLWPGEGAQAVRATARPMPKAPPNDADRTRAALELWHSAQAAEGTPAARYLKSRGLRLPDGAAQRFAAAMRHPTGTTWPAMVGLVTRADGVPTGIHRTFLAADGTGKAPITPAKMMLGPCKGGAVRLAPAGPVLMVGEGIESCLAAMQATGRPSWAALSASGLRAVELPPTVREVIVLADGDQAGADAARECARRMAADGRKARIAWPPAGQDFNDVLLRRAQVMEVTP